VKTAIYPGTFDPVTLGHVDVVQRGLKLFDKIIIAVADSPKKSPMFDVQTRLDMVNSTFDGETRIQTLSFDGLLVNLAQEHQAIAILRGLRPGEAT
jgi:pantetheine-phosphate adenylyltransferase